MQSMNGVDGITIDAITTPTAADRTLEFAAFYATNRDAVYRAVLLATRHPERSEDAVQEAFARAYDRWEQVAAMDRPRAWVIRVALNVSTSWWRRIRRELANPPDRPGAPDERPLDGDLTRLVWELPLRQRQVVALRVLADLSTVDTAQALGIAEGTVKALLHRALRRLRATLEESGEDR